jgi:hypothetical protein
MAAQNPPIHRRLAVIGLQVGGPFGFALAGGHAVAAHGILQRPSEDVDLFADWDRRADFPAAVDAMIAAYRADGLHVQIEMQTDLMARLHVMDPEQPDELHRVELVANWRFQPPVQMDIGPVLHPDDVMAGKIDALCNRAAARDFLDIDAAIIGGHYTLDRLCEIAHEADRGFDRRHFAAMLGLISRLDDDDDFAVYGATPDYLAGLRLRVADWRIRLTTG